MTTMEDERRALNQIKAACEGLDHNSYVMCALDGVITMAIENIEDDLSMSFPYLLKMKDEQIDELKENLRSEKSEAALVKKHNMRLSEKCMELSIMKKNMEKRISELLEETEKMKRLELENIKLKAKIYDLQNA